MNPYLDDLIIEIKKDIKNKKEEYVELLDFGATIHSINVLDKKGNIGDVVLGINKASDLEKNSFAGITIGRCANRIEYGKCVIDGKEIYLENIFCTVQVETTDLDILKER